MNLSVDVFIPARGGSESVPGKNMRDLGGLPLVHWVISAACSSPIPRYVIVSTDDPDIEAYTMHLRRELEDDRLLVTQRPHHLTDGISYPIHDVLIDYYTLHQSKPDCVALMQPTSPFVSPDDLLDCVRLLSDHAEFDSVQTIIDVPHNTHWINQRRVSTRGTVLFQHPDIRAQMSNKQLKPKSYMFGNLVVTRTEALVYGCFTMPSGYVLLDYRFRGMDLDTEWDFELANALLEQRNKR